MTLTSHLKQVYEQQYENHQSAWRAVGAQQKVRNIAQAIEGKAVRKILEVGAGDGSLLALLSKQGIGEELYGLEISGSGLDRIRERQIPQLREVQLFDGYSIPYPNQYFDLVILSHVLEHVEFERTLLREIRRISRYQVIEVPKDYRFGVDRKVRHFLSYGHINVYTPSSLRFLLLTEGFRILRQKVGLYSKATYEYTAFLSTGKYRKTLFNVIKANLLYYTKHILMSFPSARIRDHFANTITLLLEAEDEKEVKIF